MVHVKTEILIDAPLQKVAAYASNPDNATEWYVNIKAVNWKTPKPVAVGSQVEFIAQFLGKKLVYTYEFTEYVPEAKLVMRTAQGPFPMETTYTWEAIDEHTTRMTLQNQGSPSGFSKLTAPLMASAMRRANQKDLKLIKSILERDDA